MGILESLGLGKKPKAVPKPISQIKLHPECMTRHAAVVPLWLAGNSVEVLNPTNDIWEDSAEPYFDPAYAYRLKHAPVPTMPTTSRATRMFDGCAVKESDSVGHAPVSPTPKPFCKYRRGDIYQSATGEQFLVLGNKYDLIANYNPSNDPDTNPLIVVRYQDGVKAAVSTRDFQGNRADGVAKFALVHLARDIHLPSLSTYAHPHNGYLCIYRRENMKDVYVSVTTGEVKFF